MSTYDPEKFKKINQKSLELVQSVREIHLNSQGGSILGENGKELTGSFRRCYVYFEIGEDVTWYKHIVKGDERDGW